MINMLYISRGGQPAAIQWQCCASWRGSQWCCVRPSQSVPSPDASLGDGDGAARLSLTGRASGWARSNAEIKVACRGLSVTFSGPLRGRLRGGETALNCRCSCEQRRPQKHQMQSRVPRDGSPNGGLLTKGKL